jgi:hypothetical protein
MDEKRVLTRNGTMLQWVGVLIALLGLAYNGVKDYQSGNIKIPELTQQKELTKVVYPVQYCLMAYDPNIDKIFYQHETGQWHDYPPQQRRYATPSQPQRNQNQGETTLGVRYGASGGSGQHVVR